MIMGKAFGIVVSTPLGMPEPHITVLEFRSQLCLYIQFPANAHYVNNQKMAQVVGGPCTHMKDTAPDFALTQLLLLQAFGGMNQRMGDVFLSVSFSFSLSLLNK